MEKYIYPGEQWLDTDGQVIHAHGGGMLVHNNLYYWYGEHRARAHEFIGIPCYTSNDLLHWTYRGIVLLPETDNESHDLYVNQVIERPKVVFNSSTQKFVMWMHVEDRQYAKARAGVAVSDTPLGPFAYLGSMRPNGGESRDMTLFQDDDGKAYLIHAADGNRSLQFNLLSNDYLTMEGTHNLSFVHLWREAPALFKHNGIYHLIASGCTGFSPNASLHAVSDSIWGEWRIKGNPFTGKGSESSYHAQPTYVFPVMSKPGTFVLMMDHWKANKLDDSRYVWFPINMNQEPHAGELTISWLYRWNFESMTEGVYRERPEGGELTIRARNSRNNCEGPPDAVLIHSYSQPDPSGLLWIGWSDERLYIELAIRDEKLAYDCGLQLREEGNITLWLNYHQLSFAFNEDDVPVIIGGTYLDRLPGVVASPIYNQASTIMSVERELYENSGEEKWNLYRIVIRQANECLPVFGKGEYIAFALSIDTYVEGRIQPVMAPAQAIGLDTNTYYKAVFC